MTLTELKYIIAVARERHFGRAAEACFVSQPTLSVAVRKLEDELGVKIFERSSGEVSVTPLGERLVEQAQNVLDQARLLKEIALSSTDPLAGPLRLGVIYTIGPYLLPELVHHAIAHAPQMPLMLQENFTTRLLEMLRIGEIDCAILAEPFPEANLATMPLYDEPFLAAVPAKSALAEKSSVTISELKQQNMLLLGAGHCFRNHMLQVCPEFARFSDSEGIQKSFEGSSLETIKHMVAAGMGITLVPRLAVPPALVPGAGTGQAGDVDITQQGHVRYLCIAGEDGRPPPLRRVVLVWRRSFTRHEAIKALRSAIHQCRLPGVQWFTQE